MSATDALLVVEDLHTRFELERGVVQAVLGLQLLRRPGRDPGHRRRVRLGQVGDGALDPAADPPAGPDRGRARAAGRGGPAGARRAGDDRRARPGDQHGFPGAVGRPQPGAVGRRADLGGADRASGVEQGRGARACRRPPARRGNPGCRAALPGLPAPVERRHAAALHDRHRAGVRPQAADRRRAYHQPGRDDPGPDPDAAFQPGAERRGRG